MPPLVVRTARLDLVAPDVAAARAITEDPAALPAALDAVLPEAWPPEAYTSEAEAHAADSLALDPALQGWLLWYVVRRDLPRRTVAGLVHVDGAPGERLGEVSPALLPGHDLPGLAQEALHAIEGWAAARGAGLRRNGAPGPPR